MAQFGIRGVGIGLGGVAAGHRAVTLLASEAYYIPSGSWMAQIGPYTALQYLDGQTGTWRSFGGEGINRVVQITSDGANYRLANMTGVPVGALITNGGSSLTNGIDTVTVTASAGGSTWRTVVGGSINTTIAITTAGSGYTYPPIIVIDPPTTQGGIAATATCAITSGAISSVTVQNIGAGYTTAPTARVYNDPRDTTGGGAALTVNSTLTNSGVMLAMYPKDHGTVLTAVPTFTFSPASTIAATAIMNFTVTGVTVDAGGAAYGNAQPFLITTQGGIVSGTQAVTQPYFGKGLITPRPAQIAGTSTAGGAITATGAVIVDAGYGFQAVPNGIVVAGGSGLATTVGQVTLTVGGTTDTSILQPL